MIQPSGIALVSGSPSTSIATPFQTLPIPIPTPAAFTMKRSCVWSQMGTASVIAPHSLRAGTCIQSHPMCPVPIGTEPHPAQRNAVEDWEPTTSPAARFCAMPPPRTPEVAQVQRMEPSVWRLELERLHQPQMDPQTHQSCGVLPTSRSSQRARRCHRGDSESNRSENGCESV